MRLVIGRELCKAIVELPKKIMLANEFILDDRTANGVEVSQ